MRSHALALLARQRGGIRIFYNFELVLLVLVEEAIEGCWGKVEGLGDEGGEGAGQGRHCGDVRFVSWAEVGEERGVRPLVWGQEVVVEGVSGFTDGMGGGEIDLFAPVGGVGGDFIPELVVAWGRGK